MGADGGGSYFTVRYFAVLGGEGWGEEPVSAGEGRGTICVSNSLTRLILSVCRLYGGTLCRWHVSPLSLSS